MPNGTPLRRRALAALAAVVISSHRGPEFPARLRVRSASVIHPAGWHRQHVWHPAPSRYRRMFPGSEPRRSSPARSSLLLRRSGRHRPAARSSRILMLTFSGRNSQPRRNSSTASVLISTPPGRPRSGRLQFLQVAALPDDADPQTALSSTRITSLALSPPTCRSVSVDALTWAMPFQNRSAKSRIDAGVPAD